MRLLLILFLVALPTAASANAGLPMLFILWPLSLPAFLPVVLVESWVVRRALEVPWRVAIAQMTKGNLFSTVIGVPLAWVASVALEFGLAYVVTYGSKTRSYPPDGIGVVGKVVLTAPWLGPWREGGNWIVPLASVVLLIPFFFASYWTEAWLVGRSLCPHSPEQGRRAVWKANLLSYFGLLVASCCWLIAGLVRTD